MKFNNVGSLVKNLWPKVERLEGVANGFVSYLSSTSFDIAGMIASFYNVGLRAYNLGLNGKEYLIEQIKEKGSHIFNGGVSYFYEGIGHVRDLKKLPRKIYNTK